MGYVESNLMNGENVVYRTTLHWIIFVFPAFFFLLSLVFFSNGKGTAGFGGFLLLVAILTGIVAFIKFKTSEFVVTNKRVIVKFGFIRRASLEILLNKVEGITVDQGILGRILNFGSISVNGTGGRGNNSPQIIAPMEFRKQVQEQIALVSEAK